SRSFSLRNRSNSAFRSSSAIASPQSLVLTNGSLERQSALPCSAHHPQGRKRIADVRRRLFLELGIGSLVMHNLARSAAHLYAQERNSVPGPIVETTNGKVQGLLDGGVSAFKGIRYGISTAGERRFMPA